MTPGTALIRVLGGVRDHVRTLACERHEAFGQVIDAGLDLIERERFWNEVSALRPDDTYTREFEE